MKLADLWSREGDLALRARIVLAGAWALFAGVGMGVALGYLAIQRGGLSGAAGAAVGLAVAAVVTVTVTAVALVASGAAGGVAGRLLHPSAGKRRADHSWPRSLLARGLVDEALRAYEAAITADPSDPEPYLEIARLHRDRLGRPDEALRWFRRARERARLSAGEARLLIREIVELGRRHLASPASVAPDLARHLAAHEGTREGDWAREALREIKREIEP